MVHSNINTDILILSDISHRRFRCRRYQTFFRNSRIFDIKNVVGLRGSCLSCRSSNGTVQITIQKLCEGCTYDSFFCADSGRISLLSGGGEMKKQKIAICDQDVEYTRQLVNYIAAKEKDSFEVTGFSDESLYRKNDENFDLLLYEETFFQNKEEAGRAKKAICLSNGEISTEQENMRVLFKYQPADRILREIHAGIGKVAGSMDTKSIWRGEKQIFAVYSPWNHRLRTPFALTAAEQLSVGKKVLYLNFSVCNGFCKSMGLEPDMDMGDLFYLLRESEEELLAKLKSGIYPLGSYQVIPPPANPEHYMEWKKGEVRRFLELLLEKTDFEVLLLDLGCVMSGFFEVLELCQRIWILKENRTSKDPGIEELKELLEKFKEGLTGRTQEVFLPGGQAWREDGTIQVEEFYMGEVGNCVRRLLGGEYAS